MLEPRRSINRVSLGRPPTESGELGEIQTHKAAEVPVTQSGSRTPFSGLGRVLIFKKKQSQCGPLFEEYWCKPGQ